MNNSSHSLDKVGILASSLCALHCAAVPTLIAFGLISGSHWLHNHLVDWLIISLGFIIAGYSLVKDFRTKHKSIAPVCISVIGFTLLLIGMSDHHHGILHTFFSIFGGLTVAFAHFLNIRKSHYQCRVVQV